MKFLGKETYHGSPAYKYEYRTEGDMIEFLIVNYGHNKTGRWYINCEYLTERENSCEYRTRKCALANALQSLEQTMGKAIATKG